MANSKGRYQPHNKSNCNSSIISTAGGLAKVQTWFCNQKGKKAITISKKRSSGTQLQCFILVGRIQESPSSPLSSTYFQVAVVGADFRLLPQKCTESYLQFAQFAQPPLDVAIEVQIHGQHQQIEMRWYAQIHITIHKKWEDTALWVDDQKNTQVMLESRQTSTDGRSTSRRTGATSWCFYLLGDDHPDHPGTYRVIQKEWEKKTVLMGRGWKHTRGARFSGCQQGVWVRGF